MFDMFSLLNKDLSNRSLIGFSVGETNLSILIGPNISDRLCLMCIKKRIESSVVYDKNVYVPVSKNTFKFAFKKINLKHLNNKIFEYDKRTKNLLLTHHLISIPGCKSCH